MCSNFCKAMEDNYQGDLADIVRASGGVVSPTTTTTDDQMPDWQFGLFNKDLYPFPDPLLSQMDRITSTGLPFLDMGLQHTTGGGFCGGSGPVPGPTQTDSNSSLFSRAIQISPNGCNNNSNNNSNSNNNVKFPVMEASPRVIKAGYGLTSSEMMNINASGNNFIDGTTGVQIPSPRNPGIKRRKSQAKKVVCIPAPAPANSKQTGEVVPSDLWAWRKYGQKPIKGSPYPRGYYRCSSSKGCSARKQVERSCTDPNMLVITYTSEHNHPWPTQRNVLAGSTRSQPTKITSKPSPININPQTQTTTNNNVPVKEEEDHVVEDKGEEDNEGNDHQGVDLDPDHDDTLSPSYRPVMFESNGHDQQPADQDFFADLVGFEGDDPLNLLFTQESKALDPLFGANFHWGSPNSSIHTKEDDPTTSSTSNGLGEKCES